MPTPETQVTLSLAELKELIGASSQTAGLTPDMLEAILTRTAELTAASMKRSMKPENAHHPEISFGSYPEGDIARPRPVLPFELIWKGFPIHKEPHLSTWWELQEYAQLKPGAYTVSLRDGSPLRVTVTASFGPDGVTVERLIVDFPCDRDIRPRIAPPFIMAYQMNRPTIDRQESFMEGMSALLSTEVADRRAKAGRAA